MSNSTSTPNTGLSYKDAGVDIEAGDALVDRIKSVAKRTTRPEVMGGLGGFGALCKIPKGYEEAKIQRIYNEEIRISRRGLDSKERFWNKVSKTDEVKVEKLNNTSKKK